MQDISIHALRGEGDGYGKERMFDNDKISIHALRGEGDGFESCQQLVGDISIHALRGEGDSVCKEVII